MFGSIKPVPGKNLFWLIATAAITMVIILVSIFSLKNGYADIFPFFYILPIVIVAYFSPRFAVYYTVILGWIFLALVLVYGPSNLQLYAVSIAWFYIFVSVGVIIAAFAGQLLHEKTYREIFEQSQAGIFTFRVGSGSLQEANRQFATILGYTPGELRSMDFTTLWFDQVQAGAFMKLLNDEHRVNDMEIELRKKDRTVVWLLATASLTSEGLGVCSVVDVTERKRIGDVLVESELRYRTLFDGASDAIFIHDPDGKIFETNTIASGLLGYTKRELMQMRMQDLDTDPEKLFEKERVEKLLSRGHILFTTAQKRKDGTSVPVEISSRTTEYFGMAAVISIARDISERQQQ